MAYRPKNTKTCTMPVCEGRLKAVALLCTLKKGNARSNTQEVCELVGKHFKKHDVDLDIVRLANHTIHHGLKHDEGKGDQWPQISKKIRDADIIIFATPIWWNSHSSLLQKVIERIDAYDEEYRAEGTSSLYNKVGGIIVTGSEDGALNIISHVMGVMHWLGLTFPPECAAYWIGEVGLDPTNEHVRRRKNQALPVMAMRMARNLAYYAKLLKQNPLKEE